MNNQSSAKRRWLLCVGLAVSILGPIRASKADQLSSVMTIVDPRCELTADPIGIDVPNPRLFWKLQSDQRGQKQTAYQILVASSEDLLKQGKGDLWDSGKVVSDASTYLRYA